MCTTTTVLVYTTSVWFTSLHSAYWLVWLFTHPEVHLCPWQDVEMPSCYFVKVHPAKCVSLWVELDQFVAHNAILRSAKQFTIHHCVNLHGKVLSYEILCHHHMCLLSSPFFFFFGWVGWGGGECGTLNLNFATMQLTSRHPPFPQWGAVDAEIKVPSGENAELKHSPFKAWSWSVYSHAC